MENYQAFAAVYDDLMDKSLYHQWLRYVQKRVEPKTKILELASGTGDLAELLVDAKYKVTVSDLSESMLELAADKIDSFSGTEYLQVDMKDFSFAPVFDSVICFDDSICYLKNEQEITQTLINVWNALKPGGKFLFDCHSLFQMDHVFPEYMFSEINEDYTFVWKSFVGSVEHSIEHDLQIFVPDINPDLNNEKIEKTFSCFEEIHHERTYPVSTYKSLLADAKFELISLTSDFTDGFDKATGRRWFFECRKAI